jgi:hypothetical protein
VAEGTFEVACIAIETSPIAPRIYPRFIFHHSFECRPGRAIVQ